MVGVIFTVAITGMYIRHRRKLAEAKRACELTNEEINEFYSGESKLSTTYEALMLPYNTKLEIPPDKLNIGGNAFDFINHWLSRPIQ